MRIYGVEYLPVVIALGSLAIACLARLTGSK